MGLTLFGDDEGGAAESNPALRAVTGSVVVESGRRLSESLLWRVQRDYFERAGVTAWRTVPHYVTCNPLLARSFAEVLIGFLGDADDGGGEPFYVVELGAGSGRFGFLLLEALRVLRAHSADHHAPLRYVMTDVAETNIAFFRAHPKLRPFVAEGLLDFARLDVEDAGEIVLRESGVTLRAGSCKNPIVVIANYVFDGVPHDAFSFRDGEVHDALATVLADEAEPDLTGEAPFAALRARFDRHPAPAAPYPEPIFNEILREYARDIDGATLLFPAAALRAVDRLAALADGRMLLVSSDKGYADARSLAARGDPELVVHGSFSVEVNYHAFRRWFEQRGGRALVSEPAQGGLCVGAFLLGGSERRARDTAFAYRRTFRPGDGRDFFSLRRGIQDHYDLLDAETLLALVRSSGHDPRVLGDCLPSLVRGRAHLVNTALGSEALAAVERTWRNYYDIGEPGDLAFGIGALLYAIEAPEEALPYFEASLVARGEDSRTLWNMALCAFALRRQNDAATLLARALAAQPSLPALTGLLWKDG